MSTQNRDFNQDGDPRVERDARATDRHAARHDDRRFDTHAPRASEGRPSNEPSFGRDFADARDRQPLQNAFGQDSGYGGRDRGDRVPSRDLSRDDGSFGVHRPSTGHDTWRAGQDAYGSSHGRFGEPRSSSSSFGPSAESDNRGSTNRGVHAGKGPKGYTRTDDRIREDVCDRLAADGDVDASEIEVKVADGEVTLEGTCGDRGMKHAAESICSQIAGVKDVDNRIKVRKASDSASSHVSLLSPGSPSSPSPSPLTSPTSSPGKGTLGGPRPA